MHWMETVISYTAPVGYKYWEEEHVDKTRKLKIIYDKYSCALSLGGVCTWDENLFTTVLELLYLFANDLNIVCIVSVWVI